jgi:hypothetical protein
VCCREAQPTFEPCKQNVPLSFAQHTLDSGERRGSAWMTAAAEGAAGGASAGVSDVEMGLASGSPPATRPNKTTLASVLPRWWRLAAIWFTGGAFGPNISDLGSARICRHPWRSCCWVLDRLWFGPSVLSAPASMGCGKVLPLYATSKQP